MAQGAVASAKGIRLTDQELWEIQECEKILRFRDTVLSGTHPRIKIPQHLVGKLNSTSRKTFSPNNTGNQVVPVSKSQENHSPINGNEVNRGSGSQLNGKNVDTHRVNTGSTGSPMSFAPKTARSEIDPILLSKSDELVKAEILLHRQRLERGLRDQIEQRRIAQKALLQSSESLPDFDLTEVLQTALRFVPPVTVAEAEASITAAMSPASDSFDENTFYSSQHDTPEPSNEPRDARAAGEVETGVVATVYPLATQAHNSSDETSMSDLYETSVDGGNKARTGQSQSWMENSAVNVAVNVAAGYRLQIPDIKGDMLSNFLIGQNTDFNPGQGIPTANTSFASQENGRGPANGMQIFSEEHLQYDRDQQVIQNTTGALLDQAFPQSEVPVLRAHDLSPLAPRPSRVSPLLTTRLPLAPQGEASPAQVVGLRKEPGLSSTDSSANDMKKQQQRKKHKARKISARHPPDSPIPYIKPEPRSPSPFGGDSLPRSLKRQRIQQVSGGLNYDDPSEQQEETTRTRHKENRPPQQPYDRPHDPYETEQLQYNRLPREAEVDSYRRQPGLQYTRRPPSPDSYALPYSPTNPRPLGPVAHTVVDAPRFYSDVRIPSRTGLRADGDRDRSRSPVLRERNSPIIMGPPRMAPRRVVVDAHGREYYLPPPPPPIIRQSVAPDARYGDDEGVYERAPIRTVPSRVAADTFEEDGVLYRRASPVYTAPRRVVYQEPETVDYRAYREREYSTRPVAIPPPPRDEYVQIRGPAIERTRQMSHFEEAPREYIQRVASVRPEARYELPREYVGRVQSARPGAEYAPVIRAESRVPQTYREVSVRPGEEHVRREYMPPPLSGAERFREVSVRPDVEVVRREYAAPPGDDRYYARPSARPLGEPIYIDAPRRGVPEGYVAREAPRRTYGGEDQYR